MFCRDKFSLVPITNGLENILFDDHMTLVLFFLSYPASFHKNRQSRAGRDLVSSSRCLN